MHLRALHLILSFAVIALHCSSASVKEDAKFSYENIYQDRYQRGSGGIIPITLERGETYSGTITRDNRYLYFASNTSGNYDLYLRDLHDVVSIPIVQKVTNQREPSISPNGKYLAYVDDELDPDGDIVLLKVNPKKLISLYRERREPDDEWFASKPKNLTNSEAKRIRARDANPNWSPDGAFIAYSSDLDLQKADELGAGAGAMQNIWIMPIDDPDKKRMLTTKGGVMPSFSNDGKKIVYVSYEDKDSLGAVYEIDIATGENRKITSGNSLDFYPSYAPDDDGIVLTRIAGDSNGDGHVDRKDAGQIIRVYPDAESNEVLKDDDLVPLTSRKDHVFDSRVSGFVGGSVVHAQVKGDDINIAFIPLSGAVPVKPDVRQQIDYLQTLVDGNKFKSGHCSGLHQLSAAFANSDDIIIYAALADIRRARCDERHAEKFKADLLSLDEDEVAIYKLLNDFSLFVPTYTDIRGVIQLSSLYETKDPEAYFEAAITDKKVWRQFREEGDNTDYRAILSFIRHEQALYFARQGKLSEARETVQKIIRQNPSYLALDELLLAIGKFDSSTLPSADLIYLVTDQPDATLLEAYSRSDKKASIVIGVRPHIRREAEKFLLALFEKQFETGSDDALTQFIKGYPEKKYANLNGLYALAEARNFSSEEQFKESDEAALRVRPLIKDGSFFRLLSELMRGGNAEIVAGADAAIQIYAGAIDAHRDSETPEELREVIKKIAVYYKTRAESLRSQGNDRDAAREYEALLDLYLNAHANKLSKELPAGDLLDFALSLDQIAVRARGNNEALLDEILKFYDDRIDIARRFLVTEFLFGRGFLRAQLGIVRHQAAEADGISKSEKKQVFEDFRKAEIDMNWCFFTNPQFADAYVMLGWIYQYIDEKREVVLESSSGKKDREVFESLYKIYFPDFLFEKNIQLYQKSLALFGQGASKRVKNSFHLNIANNYFLLNNYGQAEIHYSAILDQRGNPDFRFESNEQEFMFYYHLGRTLYFTGKHEDASRYLKFVENNLNSRYPLQNQPVQTQKENQVRRETAFKVLALNSEYEQNLQAAISFYRQVENDRRLAGAETPASMIYLELARLNLRLGDYNAALGYTNSAEDALAKEKEIAIPKFKLRVKWFWVYEPWTTMIGWIYKLSYDDIFIGDNHLAFDLPTVNRYQLLHSIRSDIYRNKGLLHEASASLGHLIEYAEKDNTNHGRETQSAAVSRKAELEFQMKNWDESLKNYETALKKAEKAKNANAELLFRKNIVLVKLRKLETETAPIGDKIKLARTYHDELAALEEKASNDRIEVARKALKEREDPAKKDLSEKDIETIRQSVKSELKPLLYYKALFLAHEAELIDFRDRLGSYAEDFDQFLARKHLHFARFSEALKYFRGYSREGFAEVHPDFEPDLKNNSLRVKLAMNRAKLLQEMNLFDEAVAEFKAVQEKSQEFRANLEYAIASYRAYRLYEEIDADSTLALEPYQNIVRYFKQNQSFLRANTDLFERLCNILIDRAIKQQNYFQAIQLEDQKRQLLGLQLYFDDLKFQGEKEESFEKLLISEERRATLQAQIRTARLAKAGAPAQEKELAILDEQVVSLRRKLAAGDRLDYRYETFFTEGFSEGDAHQVAEKGILYVMRPRDELIAIFMKAESAKKPLVYEQFTIDRDKDQAYEFEGIVQKTGAKVVVLHSQILDIALKSVVVRQLSAQTSLRAQLNFSHNPERARRNVLQITKSGSLFNFGGSNDVAYASVAQVARIKDVAEVRALPFHNNVIDYEAELGRKSSLVDNANINPAHLYTLSGNPNFAILSRDSKIRLSAQDEFRFMTAADLYFSAMGAGTTLYTFSKRSDAAKSIDSYLAGGAAPLGMISTGNSEPIEARAGEVMPDWLKAQKKSYLRKIDLASRQRAYAEGFSYAEDALSLLPNDVDILSAAAEIKFSAHERDAGLGLMRQIAADQGQSLARRREFARLYLKSGDISGFETYVKSDIALRGDIARLATEFEGYMQLAAFETGEVSVLERPFVWQTAVKGRRTRIKAVDLAHAISDTLKDEQQRNQICEAAIDALEFALVLKSCPSSQGAPESRLNRERLHDAFGPTKKVGDRPLTGDDLDFIRAYSLLAAGFVSDSLPLARNVFQAKYLGVSQKLLAFNYLRILADRKANPGDIRAIVEMLATFGRNTIVQNKNLQAQQFVALLVSLPQVMASGEGAIAAGSEVKTSGLISAQNRVRLYALGVSPSLNTQPLRTSSLTSDKVFETDLNFYLENTKSFPETIDCARKNCSHLVKRALAQNDIESAVFLMLRSQNSIKARAQMKFFPASTAGVAEVFDGEFYSWVYNGANFEVRAAFDLSDATLEQFLADKKYFFLPTLRDAVRKRQLSLPRTVALMVAPEMAFATRISGKPIAILGKPDAMLSSLVSTWGAGPKKKSESGVLIRIRDKIDKEKADLHIYSIPISESALTAPIARGYHLFALPNESQSAFVNFTAMVVENMIKNEMPIEDAYFATFKMLKKIKQNERPKYYLLRY